LSGKIPVITHDDGVVMDIELEEDILKKNTDQAKENRRLLDQHHIKAIDVMGSIGSGKTSLIGNLCSRLKDKHKIAFIAGDLTTTIDADRVKMHAVETVQLNTGKECHLDALLVRNALKKINLNAIDLLIIENVGNLICPAEFNLGAHLRIVIISVTEGPYMVVKHPYIFMDANITVINKIDLAEAMDVDPDKLVKDALTINPKITAVKTSVKTGEGIDNLIKALEL
jgi:hydrogenase nickel incorporation protein HypB